MRYAVVAGVLALGGVAVAGTFTNPIDVKVADPCIVRFDGVYYLYGTAARPADADVGMPVWTSADLVHWRDNGFALRRGPKTWGQQGFWGPEVRRVRDGYFMYYGAFHKEADRVVSRICVARSDAPLGPFDEIRAPMFDWEGPGDLIDPYVFEDGGAAYLYFVQAFGGRNSIWVARLEEDRLTLRGEPRQVLVPDQPWELDPVNEGPFVWREGDSLHLMFSVNDFRRPYYGMGLAHATNPLGPWTKRTAGPVLRRGADLVGPGCAGLIESPDGRETWAYYHVHLAVDGYQRQLALSPTRWAAGELRIAPPTRAPQAAPSGAVEPPLPATDRFDSRELDRARWTVVDEDPGSWKLDDGALTIVAQDGDMWRERVDYRNLFLQPPPSGDISVSVRVRADLVGDHEQVCLVAWQDADNYVRLGSVWAGGPRLSAAVELRGLYEEVLIPSSLGPELTLRLTRRGDIWTFEVRRTGEWNAVGSPREAPLSRPRLGFTALAPGTKRRFPAVFREFAVAGR